MTESIPFDRNDFSIRDYAFVQFILRSPYKEKQITQQTEINLYLSQNHIVEIDPLE